MSSSWNLAFSHPGNNIFEGMTNEDYKKIRERVVAMILATDMNFHFGDLAKLKGRLTSNG